MEEKLIQFLKNVLDGDFRSDVGGLVETEAENKGYVERVNRPHGFDFVVTEAGEEFLLNADVESHDLGE